jgi:hypothetical protein
MFHHRDFERFPSPPQVFYVYAALNDGLGLGKLTFKITRLETEADIKQKTLANTSFPGLQTYAWVLLRVRDCVFDAPGRYELTLRFHDASSPDPEESVLLSSRYLNIMRSESNHE